MRFYKIPAKKMNSLPPSPKSLPANEAVGMYFGDWLQRAQRNLKYSWFCLCLPEITKNFAREDGSVGSVDLILCLLATSKAYSERTGLDGRIPWIGLQKEPWFVRMASVAMCGKNARTMLNQRLQDKKLKEVSLLVPKHALDIHLATDFYRVGYHAKDCLNFESVLEKFYVNCKSLVFVKNSPRGSQILKELNFILRDLTTARKCRWRGNVRWGASVRLVKSKSKYLESIREKVLQCADSLLVQVPDTNKNFDYLRKLPMG